MIITLLLNIKQYIRKEFRKCTREGIEAYIDYTLRNASLKIEKVVVNASEDGLFPYLVVLCKDQGCRKYL